MNLKNALLVFNDKNNKKDILEILWITFTNDYLSHKYYLDRINQMHKWKYFISDLDGTFFRGVLQKEAFTLFVKFVKKQNYLNLDLENYYLFLQDVKFFNELEKKAYNKEIEFFEYLNAWIYLLLKHQSLINWEEYLSYVKYSFKMKEKINPFRFSFRKIKEILESGNNFLFVSWAPNFIFDIYLEQLKEYISKNIWKSLSNNIFWFWSYVSLSSDEFVPLWWVNHKESFINILKDKKIIDNVIWGMWDTSSDYWISFTCDDNTDFFFVNPEKKVLDSFDRLNKKEINYHLIIERKDLIFEFKKEDIKII